MNPSPSVSLSWSDSLQCQDLRIVRGLAGDSSRLWRELFHCKDEEWHVVVLAKLHKLERQKDFWRHRETWPTSQEARSLGLVEQMLHRWACAYAHTYTETHRTTHMSTYPVCRLSTQPFSFIKIPTEKRINCTGTWVGGGAGGGGGRRGCGCAQAWTDVVDLLHFLAEEEKHHKREGVCGSFGSYLVGFL